jgi:hypothetical protein
MFGAPIPLPLELGGQLDIAPRTEFLRHDFGDNFALRRVPIE